MNTKGAVVGLLIGMFMSVVLNLFLQFITNHHEILNITTVPISMALGFFGTILGEKHLFKK